MKAVLFHFDIARVFCR